MAVAVTRRELDAGGPRREACRGRGAKGARAPGGPPGPDRGPLRRPPARALGRQGAAPARRSLSSGRPKAGPGGPPLGPAEASEGGRGGAGGVQKGFAAPVAGGPPEHARGKPVEIWF